jgi:hypothetical protein
VVSLALMGAKVETDRWVEQLMNEVRLKLLRMEEDNSRHKASPSRFQNGKNRK